MALFVHLAPHASTPRIRRSGITRTRKPRENFPGGIFAVPVTRNFFISHQWLRELKRRGRGPISAIYFRIPDSQPVHVGHYNHPHRRMTAAQAVAEFMSAESREGWQVIIPRPVAPAEIHRIRPLRQIFGWRYYPNSHGHKPCPCPYCTRGEFKSASIRRRLGETP
jgi:hypothetical protein